jgi:alpha-acetolactate decarboxylase
MRRRGVFAAVGFGLILCACRNSAPPPPRVRWFGALHEIMHQGRTAAAVRLADVVPGPHAWGLGALEGLNGEVTVLNDSVWLARPGPDGHASIEKVTPTSEGAALFVVANVATWREESITERVPVTELDAFLDKRVSRSAGPGAAVALRIEGPVSSLRWHVVDGSKLQPGASHAEHARSAVSGILEQADAVLVGFYSSVHQGVFTHAGSRSHLHVLVESPLISGHVDAVTLEPGARLFVAGE